MADVPESGKLAIIPEVYYDLISRIPSGFALIVIADWLLSGKTGDLPLKSLLGSDLSTTAWVLIFLVTSYVVGLAVSPLTYWAFKISDLLNADWLLNENERIMKSNASSPIPPYFHFRLHRLGSKWQCADAIFYYKSRLHTRLKSPNSTFSLEIEKHRAEAALFMNMASGIFALVIIRFVDMAMRETTVSLCDNRLWWLISGMVLMFSVGLYRDRTNWRFAHAYYEKFLSDMEKAAC
jgi:hypothetical protein